MIPEINNDHTRVFVNNMYDPTKIIKYKRGEAFYFFHSMMMGKGYNKNTSKMEDVVRFFFHRAKDWDGNNKHDFKNGEMFTDRFEFVDFNSIPNGSAKDDLIRLIKKHNPEYKFLNTYMFSPLYGENINRFMNDLKQKHHKKNLYEGFFGESNNTKPLLYAQFYGESDKDFDKRLKDTIDKCSIGIGDYDYNTYVDNANVYENLRKLAEECGQPIITAVQKTPETVILKKHTHKKDNKIVIDEPTFEFDINEYAKDLSNSYYPNAIIGGVDCATSNSDNTEVLISKIMDSANTISQHMTSPAADYIVTSQYVSDQLNNAMGIPKLNLGYSDTITASELAMLSKIKFGDGGIFNHNNDEMKVLSKKDKKIDNKVCMLQDKLVIL